ncbi:MAG: hypothetical protein CML41_00710 [Rhodobacteraceae bacterium]|jgi:hypothetical protein|uniref:Uncharacterized protein n=1 Tax=viral metagenome TaxID=1070528 RepID=A0A6C0CLB2_9ZZZZ|nr:hypothetical protein [Paracoccaceae bacterium]|tara:strand:+ start:5240 stop:5452 length:213 start_codon:yes stop_codon:yes gene_type:complete
MDEYLRDPASASLIAGAITAGYIHSKAKLNNEGDLETSAYAKPAALVMILVYFIVSNGIGHREVISTDPF